MYTLWTHVYIVLALTDRSPAKRRSAFSRIDSSFMSAASQARSGQANGLMIS